MMRASWYRILSMIVLAALPCQVAAEEQAALERPVSPLARTLMISGTLVGVSLSLDRTFQQRFARNDDFLPDALVAEPGEALGDPKILVGGTGALLAAGLVFGKPQLTRTSAEITAALAAATVGATTVKLVSDRTRPNGHNDYSFPSGHTTGAFAVATVLDREFGGWVGPVAYGTATAIGFSRMSDRYHYLSDVVAGAVFGHFIGKYITRGSPAVRERSGR